FYIYHYTCRSSRCSWSDFSGDDFGITLLNRPWRHTFTSRPRSLGGSLFSATSSRKTIAQEIDSIQCASVSESVVGDSHACLGSLNQRQDDLRFPVWLMIDRIVSHRPAPVVVQRLAGVRVDIKPGKVAAGNIQPDSVSLGEYKGRWIHPDLEPIDLPRLHRRRLLQRIAIPRPHDAIRDVQLAT